MPTAIEKITAIKIAVVETETGQPSTRGIKKLRIKPLRMPMAPPIALSTTASVRNWRCTSSSVISHPPTMTHAALGEKGRKAIGITDGMVRISVGIEDVEDLFEDLD